MCLWTELVHAAAPTLDYLFPAAWKRGFTLAVTVGGKLDPWPVNVWADCPGVASNAETNNGRLTIQIAEDAPLGPHLLRVYNQEGASAPRWFVITREQDEQEKEPNDNFKQAQVIEKLPVVIAGRLEKNGDIDCFAVKVEAGQWLVARVDAFSLGSPVDAVLHLLDERGVRLAFNHDRARSLDPLLACKIEKSGTYILQLAGFVHPPAAEVRYAGSAATVYRLGVTDGPFANHVFPAGVQRRQTVKLHLLGWNLESTGATLDQPFDASSVSAEVDQQFIEVPGVENRVPIAIGDLPEQTEIEPNNTAEQAQLISPPCAINGRLSPAGDEDRFRFSAQKGEKFEFRIQSASLGFPLEATLRITDVAGQPLVHQEDRGGSEPKLGWAAPTNGAYVVAVGDLFRHGGDDFVYRLLIAPPKPDFQVAVAESAFRLEPGKTNELKLEVTRINGHTNALVIEVEGLPDGVTAKSADAPSKSGELKVALMAVPEAKPASQRFRISVRAADASSPKARFAVFDLRGKESGGERLINQTDQLWLTVLPKPAAPPVPAAEAKKE